MTNKERYRQLCETEPSICIYDQPWYMNNIAGGGGGQWDVLLYEKNGSIDGTLVYYVKERAGLRYITQPPLTQHNGIWIRYPENLKYEKRLFYEKTVMTELLTQLEALPVVYYQQNFAPRLTNWLPFFWRGYQQETRYTYILPCAGKSMAELEKGFAQVIRYDIKNAGKAVEIEESDDIDAFYKLHVKTFERQGIRIGLSSEYIRRFDACCKGQNARKIYLAKGKEDGAYYCGIYLIYDENTVYYLMSGTDPQYRKVNALSVLLLEGIAFAAKSGRDFDFEGSMVEKIEDYFRKFGAVQTPYFHIHKIYAKNPLLGVLIKHKIARMRN